MLRWCSVAATQLPTPSPGQLSWSMHILRKDSDLGHGVASQVEGSGESLRTQAPQEVSQGAMSFFHTRRPHAPPPHHHPHQGFPKQRPVRRFELSLWKGLQKSFAPCRHCLESCLSNASRSAQVHCAFSLSPKPLTGVILFGFPDKGQLKWKSLETRFSLHSSSSSWPGQRMGTVPVRGTLRYKAQQQWDQGVLWGKCKTTAPEGVCLWLSTVAHAGCKVCCSQIVPEGSYIEEGRLKEKLPALHVHNSSARHRSCDLWLTGEQRWQQSCVFLSQLRTFERLVPSALKTVRALHWQKHKLLKGQRLPRKPTMWTPLCVPQGDTEMRACLWLPSSEVQLGSDSVWPLLSLVLMSPSMQNQGGGWDKLGPASHPSTVQSFWGWRERAAFRSRTIQFVQPNRSRNQGLIKWIAILSPL
jgi:hypothetical protein